MLYTRRYFLKTGASAVSAAAASGVIVPTLFAQGHGVPRSPQDVTPASDDPQLKMLVQRALDAAKSAGAQYADVRMTHNWERELIWSGKVDDSESMTVGVRALINGYWGFAASPVWSTDEMTRLGREAVRQASVVKNGKTQIVAMETIAGQKEGHWTMPVKIDPFMIHPSEIVDHLRGIGFYAREYANRKKAAVLDQTIRYTGFMQDKVFGSTEGHYYTQRLYRSSGAYSITMGFPQGRIGGSLDLLTPASVGWELYQDQPLREEIKQLINDLEEEITLPAIPIDVGRYDAILDAPGVAGLVSSTVGLATELDRCLGYEANASGTSYITDPVNMTGTFKVGSPLLNVTANRTEPGGVATVSWDDEGITPTDFTVVQNGLLSDYATGREMAGWLQSATSGATTPIRSRGCVVSGMDPIGGYAMGGGLYAPLVRSPNLRMVTPAGTDNFDTLIAGMKKGIEFRQMNCDMDFQQLNGFGIGRAFEIRDGKRTARIFNAGVLFRAPEMWKSLTALGSASSAVRSGVISVKGEPAQRAYHSVTATPAIFKDLTVIDIMRKA